MVQCNYMVKMNLNVRIVFFVFLPNPLFSTDAEYAIVIIKSTKSGSNKKLNIVFLFSLRFIISDSKSIPNPNCSTMIKIKINIKI